MADLEKIVQKLSLMEKDPIGSFEGKLYLNTRFFFVKIDCLSLENLQSVDDADLCIDFLQSELSDLEIYFKYDIGIKPEYKKELSELSPDVFIELEKKETANALKIAISRYERRRQDLQNTLQAAPQVQVQVETPKFIKELIELGYIKTDCTSLVSLNEIAKYIYDSGHVDDKLLSQILKKYFIQGNGKKYGKTAIYNAVNYAKSDN
ncbi:MAG: hypothetical protein J5687_09175 [Treponema sp.]|nr:hypothetical protein [Treponema sp.]